jgi:CTP:molybdopterin cytidylyltransferase MocA
MRVTKHAGKLQPVSAVILAAGSSSRMGQAKQLLALGESTVLAQTLAHVQAAALDEIILVLGASAEAIHRRLPSPQELKIVVNPDYQQGIASSLRTGLTAVDPNSDAALIILGDQPFLRPQTLDRIAARKRRLSSPCIRVSGAILYCSTGQSLPKSWPSKGTLALAPSLPTTWIE